MPRNWPPALLDAVASPAAALALLVTVRRTDGEILTFTGADEPITRAGRVHAKDAGVKMSAANFSIGTNASDDAQIEVLLDVSAISEDDIAAGRYKGALIEVGFCLVSDPEIYGVQARWYCGTTTDGSGMASATALGITSRLKVKQGPVTSKRCRCILGNAQCKKDMNGSVQGQPIRRVATCVPNGKTLVTNVGATPDGFYAFGKVEATSGPNSGIQRDVKTSAVVGGQTQITLRQPFPFLDPDGFSVILEAGCNKLLRQDPNKPAVPGSTCEQFGNCNNHHGEHDLPGNTKTMKDAAAEA